MEYEHNTKILKYLNFFNCYIEIIYVMEFILAPFLAENEFYGKKITPFSISMHEEHLKNKKEKYLFYPLDRL